MHVYTCTCIYYYILLYSIHVYTHVDIEIPEMSATLQSCAGSIQLTRGFSLAPANGFSTVRIRRASGLFRSFSVPSLYFSETWAENNPGDSANPTSALRAASAANPLPWPSPPEPKENSEIKYRRSIFAVIPPDPLHPNAVISHRSALTKVSEIVRQKSGTRL